MRLRFGTKASRRARLGTARTGAIYLLLLSLLAIQGAHADQKPQEFKADPNWLSTIQKNIEDQEYRPSKQTVGMCGEKLREPKWQINNRAQGFKSAISKEGWEIVPQPPAKRIDPKDPTKHLKETAATKDDAPQWHWRYRFSAISRGSERTKLSAPAIRDESDTVYVQHSPAVSEWYKNSRAGIEQGFELKERPHAKSNGELVLVGEIKTDLAVLNPTREKIGFSKSGAEVVQYAGLKVTDASGKTLPSWLSYSAKGKAKELRIHVDDSQAAYPLVVDPLATSPSWTMESNQDSAGPNMSVSTAGDVNGDGYSDVVVGVPRNTTGDGQAFLYLGSASGLATSPAWTDASNQTGARYGWSVSTAGDVNGDGFSDVLVGAPLYDHLQNDQGRAFLYLGSGSGLATTAAWTGEADQASAQYGASVSTAGDVNGDGYSDVLVGAYYYDNGQIDEGQAYLYLGSASGLATTAAWTGEPNQGSAGYGSSVSTAGDINGDGYSDVLVGAPYYDNGENNEGQAYLYLGSGSGLATTAAWTGESNQVFSLYGYSVSTAGDVNGDGYSDVVVGAGNYDNGENDEGQAYVYLGSGSGLATSPAWTGESNQAVGQYGYSVSTAGDVNGDGYSDVLVGASGYDNGEVNEGQAYLYLGSASGLATTAAWTGESNQESSTYGSRVSTAGDVNGDGASDVVVAAYYYDNGQTDEGRAFLYQGILDATPTPTPTPTPVAVSPGSDGLPAPAVTTSGRSATITAPQVTPQLSARARNAAIKKLMQRGLTRAQAMRALLKLKITYIFTVSQGGSAFATASDDVETQASSITRRSKRNQITLSNLPPGAKTASYRIEIATRKPPVVLGTTKPSAKTEFTIPAG